MSIHAPPAALDRDVIFYYSGYLSQAILQATADAVRLRLEQDADNSKVRRKVLSTLIEMGQNIVHYSADCLTDPGQTSEEIRFGSITVACREGHFHVSCANPIEASACARLEPKLALVSRMSLEEIKAAYRATLRQDQGEDGSKGAGLGLLTLARDASDPLTYRFSDHPTSPNHKIFELLVTI
ncbi:MAG TPA: SiaB family protein kinase [Caulobacteraceae bacterium]|jgi:hypothetical protein